MHVGHDYRFLYTIQQNNSTCTYKLSATTEERDLGIVVTDNLGVSTQCAEAAKRLKRAMKVLSMIRRQFKDMDKKGKELLEKVKRRFTKMIKGMKGKSYEKRLQKLNLWSLEQRRNRQDLIEVFKICKGFTV